MLVAIFYTMAVHLVGKIFFHIVKINMFKWVLPGNLMPDIPMSY